MSIHTADMRVFNIFKPNTCSSERGFEILDTDNSEQKPEKPDEKGHIDQQRRCLFQTSQDNLGVLESIVPMMIEMRAYRGTTGEAEKSQNSQAAQHAKHVNVLILFNLQMCEHKRYPEGDNGEEV